MKSVFIWSYFVNSFLSDIGATSIKVTFMFKIYQRQKGLLS